MYKANWMGFAFVSLILTMTMGFTLRLRLAGFQLAWLQDLDLRQAHSHLGYYGFLFPMAWGLLQGRNFWTPQGFIALFYKIATLAACLGFLLAGYGIISHVGSFCVLVVWLLFAFKNFRFAAVSRAHWLGSLSPSVIMGAVFVGLVAISAARGMTEISARFVRSFLVMLVYGVFVPIVLDRISKLAVASWVWVLNCLSLALFVFGGSHSKIFGFGPLALCFILLASLWGGRRHFLDARSIRSGIYVLAFAFSLFFLGTSIISNTHLMAIAGLHFLVLGLCLGQWLSFNRIYYFFVYDFFVILMVAALMALSFWPSGYNLLQFVAALSGMALLIISCVFSNFRLHFYSKSNRPYDLNHNRRRLGPVSLS